MTWNGWRFRSQAEAYAAMFLHKLGVTFQYEPEAYALDDGAEPTRPDFWLPDMIYSVPVPYGAPPDIRNGVWLEIKGNDTFDDRQVRRLSAAQHDTPVYVATAPLWVRASNGRETRSLFKYAGGIRIDDRHEFCRCARCEKWTIQYRGYQSRHDCGIRNPYGRDALFERYVEQFETETAERIAEAGIECERFRVWSTIGR
jgi:hypothetical protein